MIPHFQRTFIALAMTAVSASPSLAALAGRDLDGDAGTYEAYFDDELGITWLADWNLPQTSGHADDGDLDWHEAVDWAAGLNYFGLKGWRLPSVSPVNGHSFQTAVTNNGTTDRGYAHTGIGWGTTSELGHLFYVTLGRRGYCAADDAAPGAMTCPQPGWNPVVDSTPFTNMQSGYYWSSSELDSNPDFAWGFNPLGGMQNVGKKVSDLSLVYAVAVRTGDVTAAVPEPATWTMLLSGMGLVTVISGLWRRKPAR